MIDGVKTKKLVMHPDERGRLMELFRFDDDMFQKFGQVYMTTVYSGVVKAWHHHKIQTDHFACVRGMIKLVLYDQRESSSTNGELLEFFIGDHNHTLVSIPPGVLHGFKGISDEEAIVINVPTEAYNPAVPDEYRKEANDPSIPYDWTRKDG